MVCENLGREDNDYDQLLADFTEAIRLDPKDAAAYYNRGTAYSHMGSYGLAVADFTEALRLNPTCGRAYHNRGFAQTARKEYELAIADYSAALRLDPNDAIACNSLAWLWAVCPKDQLRDGPRAVEYARKACELSHWMEANYLGTLGAASAEAGQFDEALKWERMAMKDFGYVLANGEEARQRLRLYAQKKPYRLA